MKLSKIGELAQQYCSEIPHHIPMVELVAFQVIPNHLHVIIIVVSTIAQTKKYWLVKFAPFQCGW